MTEIKVVFSVDIVKNSFFLVKYRLMSSSIFLKIEVVFHFAEKLRLPSILPKN